MIKKLAFVSLVLISSIANAAWVAVVDTASGTFYADKSSIHVVDGYVQVLDLYDQKSPDKTTDGKTYYSTTHVSQYDCLGKRMRMMEGAYYSSPMGKGAMVGESKLVNKDGSLYPGQWKNPPPGSAFDIMMKAVCPAR